MNRLVNEMNEKKGKMVSLSKLQSMETIEQPPGSNQTLAETSEGHHALFNHGDEIAERFEVIRRLGKGGMGQVFLARDTELGREVAIKTLRSVSSSDAERAKWIRIFRRDAASTAVLNHPNIVTLFEMGLDTTSHHGATVPFIVLEHLKGSPLDELLAARRIALPQALIWLRQIAAALHAAHQQNVIHRDLKPANVFVQENGNLKILDFGIAMMQRSAQEMKLAFKRSGEHLAEHLGESIAVAGTPAYMAPEQFFGGEQDHSVDIFTFGVVAFEVLTGHLPFQTPQDILAPGSVDYTLLPEGTPIELRELLEQCMGIAPVQRPRDLAEIIDVLDSCIAIVHSTVARTRSPNIQAPSNRFVGREEELAKIGSWFEQSDKTVLTITGPGGVGKTRLAIEFLAPPLHNTNGVVVVDLSNAREVSTLITTLAGALDIMLTSASPERQLGWALSSLGRSILLLDNCDHVVTSLARLLPAWLQQAPRLSAICTTREPLLIRDEVLISMKPLSTSSEHGLLSDAGALFASRAGLGAADVGENAPAVEELVSALDGLPLAIELAAARSAQYSPTQMLTLLRGRFQLLKSTRRDLPARQSTLHETIAWSWEQLEPVERSVLAQLSVFVGPFDAGHAHDVVSTNGLGTTWLDDIITTLKQRSLLQTSDDQLRLLTSIRLFAQEKLCSPEPNLVPGGDEWPSSVQRRYLSHVVGRALHNLQLLTHPGSTPAALGSLQHDEAELRAAREVALRELSSFDDARCIQHALNQLYLREGPCQSGIELTEELLNTVREDDAVRALDLTIDLSKLLHAAGKLDEAITLMERAHALSNRASSLVTGLAISPRYLSACVLDLHQQRQTRATTTLANDVLQALETAQREGDLETQALLLGVIASEYVKQGRYTDAIDHFVEAIEHSSKGMDDHATARWTGQLAQVKLRRGQFDDALELASRAEALAERVGDSVNVAYWRGVRGHVLRSTGRINEAVSAYEYAVSSSRRSGAKHDVSLWCGSLAGALSSLGDQDRARALYLEAIEISRELGLRRDLGSWLGNLGNMHFRQCEYELARNYYEQALALSKEDGDRSREGLWLGNLGIVYELSGRLATSRSYLKQAVHSAHTLGEMAREGTWTGYLGWTIAREGELDDGRAHLERALRRAESLGDAGGQGRWLGMLGVIALWRGGIEQAEERLTAALEHATDHDDRDLIAQWSANLARVMWRTGRKARAQSLLRSSRALLVELELPRHSETGWHLAQALDEILGRSS